MSLIITGLWCSARVTAGTTFQEQANTPTWQLHFGRVLYRLQRSDNRGQWDTPFLILFVVLILPALAGFVLPKYCRHRAIRASKKAR